MDTPFERAPAGAILYDPLSETVIDADRSLARELGYPPGEFRGMPGGKLFPPAQIDILKNIFGRMPKAGAGMLCGQTLAIRDGSGRERGYFCSLRPQAESHEAESPTVMRISVNPDAAAENDSGDPGRPPRFVAEALEDGLWEFDVRSRKFFHSADFVEVFGEKGASRSIGLPLEEWLERIHPADADACFRDWRQLLRTGAPRRVQYRVRDVSGAWRRILSTIRAVVNAPDGAPRRVFGTHLDFTDAMSGERNLLAAETQLRMIFENAAFGIAVAELDGTLRKVNPALALMLKREAGELVGRRLLEYALPEDAEAMAVMLDRVVRGGRKRLISERRFRTGDGGLMWGRLAITISENELESAKCVVVMMEDVTARLARQEKLQYCANHDALTGAWSRGVLMERLEQQIGLAHRYRYPLTFCICDLDRFKRVNDLHGHQTGDAVLVEFVKVLAEAVRDTDIVGRYGGEEFGVVFPHTGVEGAAAAMDRARSLIKEKVFRSGSGETLGVTACFGLAALGEGGTAESMVAEADSALYQGKRNGRDRVTVFKAKK